MRDRERQDERERERERQREKDKNERERESEDECLGQGRRFNYSYAAFWYGIIPLCFLLLCFHTKACTVQGRRPPSAHGVGLPVRLALQ